MAKGALGRVIEVYRDAVRAGGGPVTPSCGLALYLLARLIAHHRRRVKVVDIGAGYGISTLFMACGVRDGGEGTVIAVEPLGDRIGLLIESARRLGLQDLIETVEARGEDARDVIRDADMVFVDTGSSVERPLLDVLTELATDATLLIFHDAVLHINRNIELGMTLARRGFVNCIIPIDTGLMLAVRSRVEESLARVSWELYRESVHRGVHPVLPNTARLLHVLARVIALSGGRTLVEIGSGFGFSSVWIASALRGTRARLYAIDLHEDRLKRLEEALEALALQPYCETIAGDALEVIPSLPEDVVMAFIDAKKSDYAAYLRLLEEKMTRNSLVIAHNTVSHPHELRDYLKIVYGGGYLSITALVDPSGVTLSLKL